MTKSATIRLKRPFAAQRDILDNQRRFTVLAIGRQWGKSELSVNDGAARLLRGQNIWFCSPTNKNNDRMYPKFKAALRNIPGIYTHDTQKLIRLPNGAFIQFVSLEEPDNLRGEGLHHVYIDEAAFIRAGVFDKVLRPMLAKNRGSAWFMSSPNGRNEFYQWYQRGMDTEQSEWIAFHYPSVSSPVLSADEIADIRANTPQRVFSQEYEAAFLSDGGAVFRNLEACQHDATPEQRGGCVFGIDWARSYDYTVITVIDASGTVLAIDRFNEIDWTLQRGRVATMYERWKPEMILAESNSIGEPQIEELRKSGLPVRGFLTSAKTKQQIINGLALAFEQGDISIPRDHTLMGELQAYTLERLPGGTFRYSAPSGMHDDMVMSLAIAYQASKRLSITFERLQF